MVVCAGWINLVSPVKRAPASWLQLEMGEWRRTETPAHHFQGTISVSCSLTKTRTTFLLLPDKT